MGVMNAAFEVLQQSITLQIIATVGAVLLVCPASLVGPRPLS